MSFFEIPNGAPVMELSSIICAIAVPKTITHIMKYDSAVTKS